MCVCEELEKNEQKRPHGGETGDVVQISLDYMRGPQGPGESVHRGECDPK